jgi:hypothetical protein
MVISDPAAALSGALIETDVLSAKTVAAVLTRKTADTILL